MWRGYALAVLFTALAILVRLQWMPLRHSRFLFFTLYPAIILSVWFGGFGPGIFSAVAGCTVVLWMASHPPPYAPPLFAIASTCLIVITYGLWTMRARSREAARELELFKFISDNSNDAHFLLDKDANLLYVNKTAAAQLGYSTEELIGQTVRLLNPEFKIKDFADTFQEAQQGSVVPFESVYIRKDRTVFSVEVGLTGVVFNGEPFLFSVARDITERQRLQEQIRQVQKLESLGVLAGGIAHDFSNLLMTIMGHAALAREELGSAHPSAASLQKVIDASEKAAHLTRQLLAYSGRGRFFNENLDLSKVISGMAARLRDAIPGTIEVRLDLPQALPLIEADTGQMEQLAINLVMNAAEACGKASSRITIRVETVHIDSDEPRGKLMIGELSAGDYLSLTVEDTGAGMDDKTLSQAFDPFFTTKFIGRGLGLSAVMGIVRAHQGVISVWTAPEEGSKFEILFSLARVGAGAGAAL